MKKIFWIFLFAIIFTPNMLVYAALNGCDTTDHVTYTSTAYDTKYGILRTSPDNFLGNSSSPTVFGTWNTSWKAKGLINGDEAASYMFEKVYALSNKYYVDDVNNEIKVLYIGKTTFWRNSGASWIRQNVWDFLNSNAVTATNNGILDPIDAGQFVTLTQDVDASPISNFYKTGNKEKYIYDSVVFADKSQLDSFVANYTTYNTTASKSAVNAAKSTLYKYSPKNASVLGTK